MQVAPTSSKQADPGNAEQSPSQVAALLAGVSAKCLGELRNGFGWAADLPKATPIYPGGHVGARGWSARGTVATRAAVRDGSRTRRRARFPLHAVGAGRIG
jgi:hypothetical protein